MTNKEAWEYVLENEDLIWRRLKNDECYNPDDIFQEAVIIAVHKVQKHGTKHFNSIVNSAVNNAYKKHKNNARDYNHLVERKVITV